MMETTRSVRTTAILFAKWVRDHTIADGSPKLLLRADMKRYTIEELYYIYTSTLEYYLHEKQSN